MTRIVIALALLASCASAAKRESTTGGESVPVVIAKKVAVSWGITKVGEMADIFLATTDETGKQVSHSLGRYKGECAVIAPPKEMNALSGVACRTGGTGTELHAVVQNGEDVVVLKMGIDEGVKPDPMAREEVIRVSVPRGAKIEAGT
ncbi:MAG TPA: hypothetical protein VLM79_18080 [Kofleriaceae bacterium]|nr:hypothetical protein [Kofleriaceae bacterium]